MGRYLKKPVIVQWDMKSKKSNKDMYEIISRKICELSPIKIRYIHPENFRDLQIIKEIEKNSLVQCCQIEFDFFDMNIDEFLDLNSNGINECYIKFEVFEVGEIMYSKLKTLLEKCKTPKVIMYITHENIYECANLVRRIYYENQNSIFSVRPNKKVKNFLVNTCELHKVVLEFMSIYKECAGIQLSVYDEEKIVRDTLPLNYYKHGLLYITSKGTVSLYNFLPDYDYGLTKTERTLEEIWSSLCKEHGDMDLDKIVEHTRYWFKSMNGGESV